LTTNSDSPQKSELSSVKNALRILRSFTMDEPEKRITDIAKSLGLAKSTVSRVFSTLASEGFVTKDPETQKYRLGLSVLALTGVAVTNLEILRETRPVIKQLVDKIGETAHLAILDGIDIVYLEKTECNHPVRILTHLGKRNPSYCTGSGKVLLAFGENEIVQQVINQGLIPYTQNTIIKPELLYEELARIRVDGYAVSNEEFGDGTVSIGAPIRDNTKKVIAAVSLVGPMQRVQPYKFQSYGQKLIEAGNEISKRLGYSK
jgi:IclR family KDG regulon transcriptional repressor